MAVNTFNGSGSVGRIFVTWTLFGTTDASPIYRAYSDDHGATWSAAAPVHSASSSAQGSQPVFLPDGRVAIIYWNFNGCGRRRCAAAVRKRSRWCSRMTAA